MRLCRSVLICLFAVVFSLVPGHLAQAAPVARPRVAEVTLQELLSRQPGSSASVGTALEALRVRVTESEAFTIVCRSWTVDTEADAPEGLWYLSENKGRLETVSELPMSNPAIQKSLPAPARGSLLDRTPLPDAAAIVKAVVGHSCALTQDPSLENLVILSLDIQKVIVYADVAIDLGVGLGAIAVGIYQLSTGQLDIANAIRILRTLGPGYLARIQGDLAAARGARMRVEAIQGYIKQRSDATVLQSEEWASSVVPKLQRMGLSISVGINTAGKAVGQGANDAKQSAASAYKGLGKGVQEAFQAVSGAVNDVGNTAGNLYRKVCLWMPVRGIRDACMHDMVLKALSKPRNKELLSFMIDGKFVRNTPDYLDVANNVLGEIENSAEVTVTEALQADFAYARQMGAKVRLHVRPDSVLPVVLMEMAASSGGVEILRDVPVA